MMNPWARVLVIVAVLAPLAGCSIYFGGDDNNGDDHCYADDVAGQRNPETGECTYYGGGSCGGALKEGYADTAIANPDWAYCPGACEALDETSCLAAAECRAAYTGSICPPNADCTVPVNVFLGCWGIAPSGPVAGDCWGLDAQTCSEHNDCSAVYNKVSNKVPVDDRLAFVGCEPEPAQGCYSDNECPAGYECTAATECLPPPGCGDGMACDPVCYGRCIPSTNVCDAVDCGPGSHCVQLCYPCDSTDGGACPPICQAQCVPDDGCATVDCGPGFHCEATCSGDCMPGWVCPPPVCDATCVPDVDPTACEMITDETSCTARPDCVPVYTGDDCTCYPWGCTCNTLTFDRCETGPIDPLKTGAPLADRRGRLATP